MSKAQRSRATPQAAWWGRGGHRVAVLMNPASPSSTGSWQLASAALELAQQPLSHPERGATLCPMDKRQHR